MKERNYLTVEQAKQISLISFLKNIGREPAYIKGENHWYISPLRDEHTPSFKVNNKINQWYDFGEGKGGNIIDLGIRLYACTVKEFLIRCYDQSFMAGLVQFSSPSILNQEPEEKIQVLDSRPVSSTALFDYLVERQVSSDIASRYCCELTYSYKNKSYYALGFKNNDGGFEIRNKYIKLSSSPKGITTIENGSNTIAVFEGFIDFLSFLQTKPINEHQNLDYLILNSTSFIEKCAEAIEPYPQKLLFLDNDPNGKKCAQFLLQANKGIKDCSWQYGGYKDVNEWLQKTAVEKRHLVILPASRIRRNYNKRHKG